MKILFIIDIQKGFITESNKFLIKNFINLIKSNNFHKIVATQFINKKDSQYIKSLNWNDMFSSPKIDFAVNLPRNAIIIKKHSYGLPTNLFKKDGLRLPNGLSLSKSDDIYICGTDYDACVLAVGYQLFDANYTIKFIESCIGSSSKNPLDKNIIERIMQRNFGKQSVIFQKEEENNFNI